MSAAKRSKPSLPRLAPNWSKKSGLALVARMRMEAESLRLIRTLRSDPTAIFRRAGYTPDPWQVRFLSSRAQYLHVVASRQSGKTKTAGALAVRTAILQAPALILIVSPTQRQSKNTLLEAKEFWAALQRPEGTVAPSPWKPTPLRKLAALEEEAERAEAAVQYSELSMTLRNGSRILALPGKEANIRSFSAAKLIILDEAARIPDPLYRAIRPILGVSHGRLVAISSAWMKLGWFYEAAEVKQGEWERIRVPATECPRLTPEFLRLEREEMGHRWYDMEYLCRFGSAVGALFSEESIQAMMVTGAPTPFKSGPLFAKRM